MRKNVLSKVLFVILGLSVLGLFVVSPKAALAANPTTISFQGKVVNSNGTNVNDGTYSFVFRIYNGSSPTMTTSCTSTASCLWEETQASVQVTSGVFQVELGSSCALTSSSCNNSTGGPINFATNNSLYLTMQFNGDTSGSRGGFMYPLMHMTSVPFALQADNSSTLGGLSSGSFVQLAQGLQTDSSTSNSSIAINKTGSTANILTLQKSGSSVMILDNNGSLALQPAADSANAFRIKNAGGSALFNLDSTAATGNNLVANPSFETAISNWAALGSGSPTQSTTTPYEQTHDLSITTTTAANDGAKYTTGSSFLANGTTYTLSAYVRTDSALSQTTFEMGHADDGTTPTFVSCLTGQTVTTGWKRFSCTWTSGAVTGNPFIYFRKTGSTTGTNFTIYVDDILLQTDANATTTYRNATLDLTGTEIQSPFILHDNTNGSTAFQIQNASGFQVFNIDTTDTNLISNPGFEVSAVGWSAVSSATLRRDTTKSYLGIASGQIAISSAATGGAQFSLNPVITLASTTYVVSFYSILGTGTAPTFQITYSPDGSATNACSPSGTDVTGGWTRFSCTVSSATTPSTSGFLKIAQTNSNSSTWYLDSVQMEPGSTATTYGAGQISLNGVITSPLTISSLSNSTTAFQIQNSGGNNLLSVDTTNSQVVLGNSSSVNGTLVFDNSSGTHAVTLDLNADPTNSFTLHLPTAAPSANQCMGASSTTQLTFQNCDSLNSIYAAAGTCNGSNITLQFTGSVNSAPSCSSTTLTLPSNTTKLMIEMKGGGGAGGGLSNANSIKNAAGGGEGAYLKAYVTSASSTCTGGTGAQCFYTVGGTATGSTTAVNGNPSCFGINATACTSPIYQAGGGTGGAQGTSSAFRAGGAGGTCSGTGTAALCIPGAPGGWSLGASPALGGQGGGTGGGAAINASGNGNAAVSASGGGGGGGLLTAAATTTENGGNGASGLITFYVYTGTTGADLAEWYDTQGGVSPGDVVAISGKYLSYTDNKNNHQKIAVLQKASASGKALLGVVSTAPNTVMDDGLRSMASHPEPIALTGRAPVKVSLENGPIHAGDLLTISSTAGVAMRLTSAGQPVIGQALADYSGYGGTVMTFVKTQYLTAKASNSLWQASVVILTLGVGLVLIKNTSFLKKIRK